MHTVIRAIYLAFIDYSKAFDGIQQELAWQSLREQEVQNAYVNVIKNSASVACVRLESMGDASQIYRGVRQEDWLSPKLFSAVLEQIFRELQWDDVYII